MYSYGGSIYSFDCSVCSMVVLPIRMIVLSIHWLFYLFNCRFNSICKKTSPLISFVVCFCNICGFKKGCCWFFVVVVVFGGSKICIFVLYSLVKKRPI